MMRNLSESLTVTVPISPEAYRQAEQFSLHHRNPDKAQQVYLNTLAVWAVKFYLLCMGTETNWEASLSWNPVIQILMNVADLEVQGLGKIECRPVLPTDHFVHIPREVCLDRIGYVAVQINESQKQATLLGFSRTVPENGELPIRELCSLEEMLLQLSQPANEVKQPTHLQQWLDNIFEIGWETVESFLSPQQQAKFAFRSRTTEQTTANHQENQILSVERGKLLDLGQHSKSESIVLLVELLPTSNEEIDIWVKVYPVGSQKYLPEELQLLVLDEGGIPVIQAIARSTENLQVNFSSKPAESFSVQLILNLACFTESFLV